MNALIKLDTEEAAIVILDRFCAGAIRTRDGLQFSRALTGLAVKYPTVRTAMIARYRTLAPGSVRTAFEMAMDDLSEEEVFWTLFDAQGASLRPSGALANVIRNLAIGRKPSVEWATAFEEFGLPLTELRARLFAMLPTEDEQARLAKQCLIAIDEHRDERGRVSDEPRHPDIATGRAWPPEAEEPREQETAR
jgi:hypothetical protein